MNIINLPVPINSYPLVAPLSIGWILLTKESYVRITPDGKFTVVTDYIVMRDREGKKLKAYKTHKAHNKDTGDKKGVNDNGEIVEEQDACEVEYNKDFSCRVPSITDSEFKEWLGIKDKETGFLFINDKNKKKVFMSLPIYDLSSQNLRCSFSRDGQTIIIFQKQKNKVIILDNPVYE